MQELCRTCLAEGLFAGEDGFEMPETLGGFQPLRRIGRGASGEVWLAFQPGPDREVALKVFLDPMLGGSTDRARFLAEAQALGRLDHPNIVPVHATGEEGGFLFIASRWMTGGTLAEARPEEAGRQSWRKIAGVVEKIARAAGHAHRHGLVHRDIKPANILLDGRGEPYLADFGIAVEDGMGERGTSHGTPGYMAPEQAQGGVVTTAADLYSLGAVLCDLLVGGPPRVLGPAWRDVLDGVDADLAAICLRCLEHEPEARYRSADDLAEDLARWQRGEPVQARPAGWGRRVRMWSRRRPAAAILTALVLLTAGFLALTLAMGSVALRHERNLAVTQSRLADANAEQAAEIAEEYRRQSYASDLFMANRAIEDGHLGMARALLERYEHAAGLRGLEWHVSRSLCRSEDWKHFEDHKATVSAVAVSPDGTMVASVGIDGQVVLRAVADGRLLVRLPRADAPLGAMEIPLMAGLATASPEIRAALMDGGITLDEVRMRARPSKLGELTAAAWSPDGRFLATGGDGGFIRVWSMPEGLLKRVFPRKMVRDLAYDGGGRLICLHGAGDSYQLEVFDAERQELLWQEEGVEPCMAVRGDQLAWVSKVDAMVRVRQVGGGGEMALGKAQGVVTAMEFSRDGQALHMLSDAGRTLTRFQRGTGKKEEWSDLSGGPFRSMAVLGSGLALAGASQAIAVGDPAGAWDLLQGHGDEIMTLEGCERSSLLFSGSKDRTVRWWRWPPHAETSPPDEGRGKIFQIRSDGRVWLGKNPQGGLVLGRKEGTTIRLGAGEAREILGFTDHGREAVTLRREGDLVMEWWSTEDGRFLRERSIGKPGGKDLVFGTGENHFAYTLGDGELRVLRKSDGTEDGRVSGVKAATFRIELTPDGSRIALAVWPRFLGVSDLGKPAGPLRAVTSGVIGDLRFTPDGRWLAVGSDTNRVLICDGASGEVRHELVGHRQRPLSLAFSPDGRTLVSSSMDDEVRLWHVPTWRPLGVVARNRRAECLQVSESGRGLWLAVEGRSPEWLGEPGNP
jgi:WD40 repeat protein